jgi:hypothetical protein
MDSENQALLWQDVYHFIIHHKEPCCMLQNLDRKTVARIAPECKKPTSSRLGTEIVRKKRRKKKIVKHKFSTESDQDNDDDVVVHKSVKARTRIDSEDPVICVTSDSEKKEPVLQIMPMENTASEPSDISIPHEPMHAVSHNVNNKNSTHASFRPPHPVVSYPRIETITPREEYFTLLHYAQWTAENPTAIGLAHKCTSACTFNMMPENLPNPIYICLHTGNMHRCGTVCTQVISSDNQSICALTGELIRPELHTIIDTANKIVANAKHIAAH